jgi:CPA2 family monovalent cation:H+ antiporter-2
MLNDGNFGCKCWFFPALGAFIMGSIIAETTQAEHIEHLVKPVKDLFAAVFSCRLVCLSILILYTHAWPVAILTLVVIFWSIYQFY